MPKLDVTLELVTPAFLGGADGNASLDEGLRPPSLKGMMRWWWRAMHTDLNAHELAEKEADVFGSLDGGQGLRIVPMGESGFKILTATDAIYKQYFERPNHPLYYLAYGPVSNKPPRPLLFSENNSSATAKFRFVHRDTECLKEAERAIFLLCHLGGIGSRSRKGFGSLVMKQSTGDLQPAYEVAESTLISTIKKHLKSWDANSLEINSFEPPALSSWDALKGIKKFIKRDSSQVRDPDGARDLLKKQPAKSGEADHRILAGLPFNSREGMIEAKHPIVGDKLRRAAPYFFHVHPVRQNAGEARKYSALVTIDHGDFLPDDFTLTTKQEIPRREHLDTAIKEAIRLRPVRSQHS